jgi:uroporphyrinogen decarboxylase
MTVHALETPAEAIAMLKDLWARPDQAGMSPYERVENALAHRQPDRVPFDFWAVPEVVQALCQFLEVSKQEDLLQLLAVDCRVVTPDYLGQEGRPLPDNTWYEPRGSHRKKIKNQFSTYEEYASYPLANAVNVSEVESYPHWPKTEYFDWAGLPGKIHGINKLSRHHIRYEVGGIFETAWGLYGLDRFLLALVSDPVIPIAILNCVTDQLIADVHQLMKTCHGLIDIVYTYDDVAIQNGLLMSPAMWRKFILPCHVRLNQVIKSYRLRIMYHSCGAIYPLIGELIDTMHIDVLNPLQPRARGMDMQKIKQEFGSRISFHGGIDLQETMPHGSVEDVTREVRDRCNILGRGGGYICTTAHYIQMDAPVRNILALYTAPRNVEG